MSLWFFITIFQPGCLDSVYCIEVLNWKKCNCVVFLLLRDTTIAYCSLLISNLHLLLFGAYPLPFLINILAVFRANCCFSYVKHIYHQIIKAAYKKMDRKYRSLRTICPTWNFGCSFESVLFAFMYFYNLILLVLICIFLLMEIGLVCFCNVHAA